ncbi:uncharacterized protein LOC143066435 [Mytilus galloprovincialis]|uniref:uncharacterized protein LOC143066435 n=1 Tax=Mytilus galloprovincialis TaxID=29158 RepID=UPI003F7B83A2
MEDENTLPKESTSKTYNDGDTKALEETETQALVKSKKEKGKSCCSFRRCFAAICCCCMKKTGQKVENIEKEDGKASLTSQEVNEFIEEEMKKLSEETINLES